VPKFKQTDQHSRLNVKIHTNIHSLSHFASLFFSLSPLPCPSFLTNIRSVFFQHTPPPHTPGLLRLCSCTKVCPFAWPSTSTLQKGSESASLLMWVARVGWYSCECARTCVRHVCIKLDRNRLRNINFDSSLFAYDASDTCLQSYTIAHFIIRLDEATHGNWYSRSFSSSWVSIAWKIIGLFRICYWRLSFLLVTK
jgi:hypothetical protein